MGRLKIEFSDIGSSLQANQLYQGGYFLIGEFNSALTISVDSTIVGDSKTLFAFNNILCLCLFHVPPSTLRTFITGET